MKIISSAAPISIASLVGLSSARVDQSDGKCDYMFVECEAVCEFTCMNRPDVVELEPLAHHPEVLSAIPWSNISEEELLQVDRSLHKPKLLGLLREASEDKSYSPPVYPRTDYLRLRFADYGRLGLEDPGLFSWSCFDHCKYECMHLVEKRRRVLPSPRKYFGKWPFRRVYICQEILSSAYSLLNGLPYILFSLTHTFRTHTPFIYRVFTLIVSLMWISSTIFHCRDTPLTMYLDYFTAFGGVVANCATGLHQSILVRFDSRTRMGVIGLLFVLWVFHSMYLTLINFDFEWNMTLAVAIALLGGVFWVVFYARNRRKKPHAWMVVPATWGLFPLLVAFELNDFPPGPNGLADAHSYWHLSTVPFSVMWVLFMFKESQWPKPIQKHLD